MSSVEARQAALAICADFGLDDVFRGKENVTTAAPQCATGFAKVAGRLDKDLLGSSAVFCGICEIMS